MDIDIADRPDLVRGALRIQPADDGFVALSRMTEQLESFYSYSEGALIRAKCTSSIKIVMESDTKFIRFPARFGMRCRDFSTVECYVDGHYVISGSEDLVGELDIEFQFEGSGDKHIEISLPHCAELSLGALTLSPGARVSAIPQHNRTWLAIGDSITQGMSSTRCGQIFSVLTARNLGLEVQNIAVGGAKARHEIAGLVSGLDWDVASVAFGTNDFNQSVPLDEFRDEMTGLLGGLVDTGRTVNMITVIPWVDKTEPNAIGHMLDEYRDIQREVASQFPGLHVIEGTGLIDEANELFADRVHPNTEGNHMYADNLTKLLNLPA